MAPPRPQLDEEAPSKSGSPVQIGQVVCGKYRIERQIGRGGMGIVLAATHLQLEHLVAIKVMRRDLVADDKALDRLLMEARAAARIRSEHVARVLDVGTLENGSPFIVMEYLEGENLADLLDREGALDIGQAASFLMQCCVALAEVHVADMVHRDLKPGNLFIARLPDGSPSVKIVDFGISKHIGTARDHAATTSPQVLGSPFYMSPEQMRAEAVDERSDIWGLGAILFEMLTGRPPFIADTLPEVYSAVLKESPPAVDSLRVGVPAGLDDVVQRCLEKDPAQRFCDVADLAEALAPYAGATAAASVERITRILTNPDAVRGRHSVLPVPSLSATFMGSSISAIPGAPPSVMLGAGGGMEGIMAGEPDGRGGAREQRVSRVDIGAVPVGVTWLEPGTPGVAELREHSSQPLSGEFTPFSATGMHTGRAGRGARIAAVLAAFAVLGAGGFFWLQRGTPAPERGQPAEPVVDVVKLAPPSGAAARPAAPGEPRIAPIVREPSTGKTKGALAAPRAKPELPRATPARPAMPSRRVASSNSDQTSERDEPAANSAPEPGRAAAERPGMAHGNDPWNPDSFGERR